MTPGDIEKWTAVMTYVFKRDPHAHHGVFWICIEKCRIVMGILLRTDFKCQRSEKDWLVSKIPTQKILRLLIESGLKRTRQGHVQQSYALSVSVFVLAVVVFCPKLGYVF